MDNYFDTYTVDYGARFTKRQKTNFINQLNKDMSEIGYEGEIVNGKSGLTRVRNVVFGNLKNAKTIIAVPYDTPQKSIWFQAKYFPLNGNRANISSMFSLYIPSMIVYIISLVLIYYQDNIFPDVQSKGIFSAILFTVLVMIMYYLMHGIPNRHNATRNSTSIVAALRLGASLSKDERKKVAFVFTDKNVNKHIGAMVAMQDFQKLGKSPNIIQLNCIGRGDTMMIGYNSSAKKLAQELNKANKEKLKQVSMDEKMKLQSAMDHFQKAVTIAAGEVDKKGDLVVYHTTTGKDVQVDEGNITKVVDMMRKYITSL